MLQEKVAAVVLTMATARRKHARAQTEVVIPEKIYFRIGEVSELAKLPSYVLRFWETEFPQLKPSKSSTGQRMYRRRDVEYVMQIRKLLYEDGFTIAGAREKLREEVRIHRLQNHSVPQVLNTGVGQALDAAVGGSRNHAQSDLQNAPQNGSQNAAQNASQAALPFPGQAEGDVRREELRRVRQQLRDVLDLLS